LTAPRVCRCRASRASRAPPGLTPITAFHALIGVPIVQRLDQALNFARRNGAGIVYGNGRRLVRRDYARFAAMGPAQ
jgi:hypothetical protein